MAPVEGIVVVLVVAMVAGIPLLGLTLRFSLKPALEAFIRLREAQLGANPEVSQLRDRVAHLEHMLEVHGLLDARSPRSLPASTERSIGSSVGLKDRERV
ncbi:hypothetical protein LZ198_17540 [Myxococcus sp. K15C18031901]|uniref:hypothetical protein n=1 Tax=Myxococcus dinghuensis TaxID=2906761 RepID=UPI0020A6EA22|nr:hypothetical protein [Myxococcus dinghuensis]MCP3100676.1 hypothetical protein [Myxococcus dinghuensis]